MPIPTPPPPGPNNGGFVIVTYSNGARTHRTRWHVAPYNSGSGVYNTAQGTELNVGSTVTNLMNYMRAFWTSAFTLHFAAQYVYNTGVPQQIPLTQLVLDIQGNSGNAACAFPEAFWSLNWRSSLLGRARAFFLEPAGWAVAPASNRTSSDVSFGGLIGYLAGANTGVVAHDGGRLLSPAHFTTGLNKKLRRRAGDA